MQSDRKGTSTRGSISGLVESYFVVDGAEDGLQDFPYHQGLDTMDDLFATLCSTEDAVEGVRAFLGKRAPIWKER